MMEPRVHCRAIDRRVMVSQNVFIEKHLRYLAQNSVQISRPALASGFLRHGGNRGLTPNAIYFHTEMGISRQLARISHSRPEQGRKALPEQRKRSFPVGHRVREHYRNLATEVPAASAFARSGLQVCEKCGLAPSAHRRHWV